MNFPVDKLVRWYREKKRDLPWRDTRDIYKIWVSEVMLQQTQVTTVIPYYHRFLDRFPTVRDLAGAQEEEVLKLWEGLGYYGRCRNLHRAAGLVMGRYGGRVPDTPGEFETLPGVGPYILAAVMSIARDIPLPAVDGNVIRVYTRFKGIREDVGKNAVKSRIARELTAVIQGAAPGDFNQGMMELGALVCVPGKPRCGGCPLRGECFAEKNSQTASIPFKTQREKAPLHRVSIAVILDGERFFIQKRPSRGHLGGMWEFPGGKALEKETAEEALLRECLEELSARVVITGKLAVIRHAYTHFRITMSVFLCRLAPGEEISQTEGPQRWITIEEWKDLPFPAANHKFYPALKNYLEKNKKLPRDR